LCGSVLGRRYPTRFSIPWSAPLSFLPGGALLTICSFTVLPSSSIVLIFCPELATSSRIPGRIVAWGTYKVDTNGGDIGLGVGIVSESQKQARLSDTGVTDEEELEEVVVSGCRSASGLASTSAVIDETVESARSGSGTLDGEEIG